MAPCGTTLATFLWVAPEFCFRVLVQHGLTERITHIAMFFPLTLSHYGSRRHSVRAANWIQLPERRARSDAPYLLRTRSGPWRRNEISLLSSVGHFPASAVSMYSMRSAKSCGVRLASRPSGINDWPWLCSFWMSERLMTFSLP